MTIQVKSTLIILATFLLGIVIGFLGDRWMRRPPPFNAQQMRKPEGFIQFNEKMIQPTAAQKDTVHAILAKYFKKFNAANDLHRQQLTALIDSMHAELSPILTKEQRERFLHRRPGLPPRGFGNGPGFFPPGGPDGPRGPGGPRDSERNFNKSDEFRPPPKPDREPYAPAMP